MNTPREIAEALLDIGAVGFCIEKPITFKSGMIAPVYVDNRKFPYYPDSWNKVIHGFKTILESEQLSFDIVAGIESAGIPHSAALGYGLHKPSVFCRKQVKDHGTKKLIEGGDVVDKRVILIEDLVTTGGSSLDGVRALRECGAIVSDCLVIVSYGFSEAITAFHQANVMVHPLTTFPVILDTAVNRSLITKSNQQVIIDWLHDPWKWTNK